MFTSDIDEAISLQEYLRKRFVRENTVLSVNRPQVRCKGVDNDDDDYSDASQIASFQLAPSLFHQQCPIAGGSSGNEALSCGKTIRQFFDADIMDAYRCLQDTSFVKRAYFTYDTLPLLTNAEAIKQQLDRLPTTAANPEVASATTAATGCNDSEDAELQEFLQRHNKQQQQQQQYIPNHTSPATASTTPVDDTLFPSQRRRKHKIDSNVASVNRMLVMRRLFTSQVDTEANLSLTSIEQFGDTNYARTQHRRTYILNPLDVATTDTTSVNDAHQRQSRAAQQEQQHPSDEKVKWGYEIEDPLVRPYGGSDDADKYSFDATQHWTDKRLRLVDTWIGTTANEFMDNEQCAGARKRPLFDNSGLIDIDDQTAEFVSRGTQQRITEFVLKRDNSDDCNLLNSAYTRSSDDEQQTAVTSTLLPVESRYLHYAAALSSAESPADVSPAISTQLFGGHGGDVAPASTAGAASLLTSSVITDKGLPHLSVSGIVGSRYNYVERAESAQLGGCVGIDDDENNEESINVCRSRHSCRVPRFTSIRKFQNRLALMCVNTSRLLYTVDFFRFAGNYDYTNDTLTLYALNYYLDFDIGIADRVFAVRRRKQQKLLKPCVYNKNAAHTSSNSNDDDDDDDNGKSKEAQTRRKQHFALVTHLLSLTGYEEYVFGLAYLLAFNVDMVLGSEHASVVHRYTHKSCANFCNKDGDTDLSGLSGNRIVETTKRLFSSPDSRSYFDAEQRRKKHRPCAPNTEASSSRVNGYVNVFIDHDRCETLL